jgi:hypothetical protein
MNVPEVHARSLATSTALSVYYMPELITPLQVIEVLNGAGVKFVLVGAHGLGGWMQKPRATQDVDVLVAARGVTKAVRVLLAAFPHLEADDHEVVTRLRERESKAVRIDVMKPKQPLFREALKHTRTVTLEGQSYQIPSLEMALALKFAPMISLNRADKDKHIDAHDFMYIIDCNPDIDLEQLAEFGELVYPGGGKELVEKVGQVRRGEKLCL